MKQSRLVVVLVSIVFYSEDKNTFLKSVLEVKKMWLSLHVSRTGAEFGFVASATVNLGQDYNIQLPHTIINYFSFISFVKHEDFEVEVVLQMYLIADAGFGFGVFMAICSPKPYEIVKGMPFLIVITLFNFFVINIRCEIEIPNQVQDGSRSISNTRTFGTRICWWSRFRS